MSRERDERLAEFSLTQDYLSNAFVASEAFGLDAHDPQIIAALIVAQSIDRHSEVLACVIGQSAKRVAESVETVESAIDHANAEQKTQNLEVLSLLESIDTTLSGIVDELGGVKESVKMLDKS